MKLRPDFSSRQEMTKIRSLKTVSASVVKQSSGFPMQSQVHPCLIAVDLASVVALRCIFLKSSRPTYVSLFLEDLSPMICPHSGYLQITPLLDPAAHGMGAPKGSNGDRLGRPCVSNDSLHPTHTGNSGLRIKAHLASSHTRVDPISP